MSVLNLSQAIKSGGLSNVQYSNPYTGGYTSNASSIGPLAPSKGVLGLANSSVTGGSGSTGSTGSTGTTTNTNTGIFDQAGQAAQSQNDALLSSLNTEFDRTSAQLNNQLGYLGTQKDNSLNELNTAYTGAENQVKQQKDLSATGTADAIKQAGSVAQSTQLQNRNILRALGILNSSAGGELLSKPLTEFDKQRATLVASNLQRLNQLDDFLNQKMSEHTNAVKSLESSYSQLVSQIQTDLRFNDRQRADAIKSANAALQGRLADIQTAAFNYKTQVDTAKQNLTSQIGQLANYTQPTANTTAISSTVANPGVNANGSLSELSALQKKKQPTNDYSLSLSGIQGGVNNGGLTLSGY